MAHRILIIDDEAEVRHILVDLLRGFGDDAEATGNPREVFTMTGEVPLPMVVSLFGAGDVPILRKPFTRDQLRRLVERMLT